MLAENHGIRMTEQKDRNYFRSIYFREAGGVLFEIATTCPASPWTSRCPHSVPR
jgi:glyoxalase family protein